MTDLNELQLFAVCSQTLEDSVDAVARVAKDRVDAPVDEALDK